MMLHIRQATANDAEALARLTTQLGYPSQSEEITRRLRDLPPERSGIFVAVIDNKVLGWVHVNLLSRLQVSNAAEIAGLVVDEKSRSKAIGRALLKAAEAWAIEKDCSTMYVRTNVVRHGAHVFYRHLGYQQVKTSLTFTKSLGQQE